MLEIISKYFEFILSQLTIDMEYFNDNLTVMYFILPLIFWFILMLFKYIILLIPIIIPLNIISGGIRGLFKQHKKDDE